MARRKRERERRRFNFKSPFAGMQIRKRIPYARCWHGWESSDARCVGGPRDSSVTMFVDLLAWISQHSLSKEKRHVSGSQANALWTEPAFDLLLFLCPEKSILNRSTYGIFTAIASSLNTIQMYHSRNISLSLSLLFLSDISLSSLNFRHATLFLSLHRKDDASTCSRRPLSAV